MKNLLIVDDEKPFLLSLTDGLNLDDDHLKVYTAQNGAEAAKILMSVKFDLIITDLQMPVMDGFGLLAHIASQHIDVPVIIMTAYGTPEIEERLRGIGSFGYIEKPLDIDALSEMIEAVLSESAKGHIQGINLASFMQLLEMEKKTCTLTIKSLGRVGKIYFRSGALLNCKTGDLSGVKAAYEIICWEEPEIAMSAKCGKVHRDIDAPLMAILMEASRLQDEGKLSVGRSEQPAVNEAEQNDELALDVHPLDSVEEITAVISTHKKEVKMGAQEDLKELATLDGFIGAGLFTPGGEALATLVADSKTKINDVGVLANNVLMNAQKASLDMGTGRGQQVHVEAEHANILVRCLNEGTDPLKSQPGKAHIHLVLVLGEDASIGMAKMKLNKVISQVAGEFRM